KEFVDHAAALLSDFWRIIGRRMGDNDHTNRWSLLHQPNRGAIVEIPDHPAFCRGPMNGWRTRKGGQYFGTAQQSIIPAPRNDAQAQCHHGVEHHAISIPTV